MIKIVSDKKKTPKTHEFMDPETHLHVETILWSPKNVVRVNDIVYVMNLHFFKSYKNR